MPVVHRIGVIQVIKDPLKILQLENESLKRQNSELKERVEVLAPFSSDSANDPGLGISRHAFQLIRDSVALRTLTPQEKEYRNLVQPLPPFDGTPTKWFIFIASYQDSSSKCGFSPAEDMVRIREALRCPALSEVKHFFPYPHLLPKLLSTLRRLYGTDGAMYDYTREQVRKMMVVNEATRNLSKYYAHLLEIAQGLHLLQDEYYKRSMIDAMAKKLPMAMRLEWSANVQSSKDKSVNSFVEFIESYLNVNAVYCF